MIKGKEILAFFIVIVIIIAGFLVIKGKVKTNKSPTPSATPSVQEKIENKFRGLTIPQGTENIDLTDVSGGEGIGIATRNEIVADLPVLPRGEIYQGYLENTSGKTILLGTLKMAKGGWILNYDSSKFPGYNKVTVTVGAKHILEGSF
jgi:hypothetical protein